MGTRANLLKIERRLKQAHIPVAEVCRIGGFNQSSWVRWKNGTTEARPETWREVEATAERLIAERSVPA
jgi:hypothetical protein